MKKILILALVGLFTVAFTQVYARGERTLTRTPALQELAPGARVLLPRAGQKETAWRPPLSLKAF